MAEKFTILVSEKLVGPGTFFEGREKLEEFFREIN